MRASCSRSPTWPTLLKSQAAEAGITLNVVVESLDTFYGAQWCPAKPADPPCSGAAELGIVDYGHRGDPRRLPQRGTQDQGHLELVAVLVAGRSTRRSRTFQTAVGVDAQKAACNKIETILLEDTPIGLPYFYNYLGGQLEGVHRGLLERPGADVLLCDLARSPDRSSTRGTVAPAIALASHPPSLGLR